MSEVTTNASTNIIKVSEIGMSFGREYYTVLSREPSRLHLFYAKNSTLLHADEGDLDTPISVGSEAIQNAVNKNSFLGSRFIIESIDCHPSQNGGILVNVLGQIQKRGQASSIRHFMQTFFLAEQPSGYFILNDNLRFLERSAPASPALTPVSSTVVATPEPVAAPIAVESVPIASVSSVSAEIVVETFTPIETAPITPVAPTKIKKITTAASKQKATSSPVAVATVATPVVEELVVPASPSSWAQLAAVQQNKWASGVVSLNKGTSIPSEEKPKIIASSSTRNSYSSSSRNANTPSSKNINITNSVNSNKTSEQVSSSPRRANDSTGASKPKLPFVPESSLYVTGVVDNLKSDDIRAEFAALGSLAHFDVKFNSGTAFVEYVDPAIAKIVLEEGGIVVDGTRLTVEKRRIASRNSNNHSNESSKDKEGNTKKFTATKSNRRERPATKTEVSSSS